jgi:hypothetical protein
VFSVKILQKLCMVLGVQIMLGSRPGLGPGSNDRNDLLYRTFWAFSSQVIRSHSRSYYARDTGGLQKQIPLT